MLCALLAFSLSAAPPQDPRAPNAVLEIFALPDLCVPRLAVRPPAWGSLLTYVDEGVDLLATGEGEAPLEAESAARLLLSLNAEAAENGRLEIPVAGDMLLARGDAATIATLREQVKELAAVVRRPIEIEVCAWPADGAAPPVVLGARDYVQFAAGRTPVWRAVAEARGSTPVALGQQRWTHYVRGIEVEVAEDASIARPVPASFGQGDTFVVVPHALLGGDDVVLHVQFAAARQRGELRTVSCGIQEAADIDLPLLETTFGACSARVPNGGALAMTLRGHASGGGQTVWTVRATGRVPPAVAAQVGLGIFPIGALTNTALVERMRQPSHPDEDRDLTETLEGVAGFGTFEPDVLAGLVRVALGPPGDECEIQLAAGHMFVRGGAAPVAQASTFVQALQDRVLRTATLRHAVQLAGAGEAADGALLHELVVPTLLGRVASFGRCLETNVIAQLYVQIAKQAAKTAPGIAVLQSGVWLGARVTPTVAGMHLDLRAQCHHGAAPAPRSMRPNGVLMLRDVASARIDHRGAVAAGQPIVHGDGPVVDVDGRRSRSAVVTSVHW